MDEFEAEFDEEYEQTGDWLLKSEATPITVVPVFPPRQMDGFRIAQTFDGVTEGDRQPWISPGRGYVRDKERRLNLLDYLYGGTVALASNVAGEDLLEPRRHFAVAGTCYTDGTWVWSGAQPYYLRYHGVAPEPEFVAHIEAHNYRCPRVAPAVAEAAGRAIAKAFQIVREKSTEWLRDNGLLLEGDERRFSKFVSDRLLDLGWRKGRDVWDQVQPWLDDWAERLRRYRLAERGYLPYEPLDAANAVLCEFGGLRSRDNGPGVTAARSPFVIFPRDGQGDLQPFVTEVALLSDRLGKRLFQVGEMIDGSAALLVAEDGQVYTAGTVVLFLGATFDDALTHLIEGHEATEVDDLLDDDPYGDDLDDLLAENDPPDGDHLPDDEEPGPAPA